MKGGRDDSRDQHSLSFVVVVVPPSLPIPITCYLQPLSSQIQEKINNRVMRKLITLWLLYIKLHKSFGYVIGGGSFLFCFFIYLMNGAKKHLDEFWLGVWEISYPKMAL
jgi:hypothetical protein